MPHVTVPAVEMRGIVKRFPGIVANDHIDLTVRAGEIHALLGENGAGKTTLMNILYGIYHPDEGEIFVKGQRAHIRSPRDAIRLGIGMVHQQFRLVPSHTVAENIALGLPGHFFFPDRAVRQRLQEFARRYGLHVDPDARIWQLSAGEQQRVEIIKALYRGADILILDEPTSMLTPREIEELMTTVRRMADEGHTVIFITHKLDEVFAVSDRVTVLRQGKVVAIRETARTDKRELARLMVGRDVLFRLEKRPVTIGPTVLEVRNLRVRSDRGLPAVRGVSFSIARGEILGIAGVAGNGQRELVEALVGLRQVEKGRVLLNGEDITNRSPRDLVRRGICYVPGERLVGTVPNLSVAENLILKTYDQAPICRGVFLDTQAIASHADALIEQYAVTTPSRETPLKLLSGGNIQRTILARETSGAPVLLIAAHPTSGLDVGATEYIRQVLLSQREKGTAILLVSEDLEEIFQLSDRIAVMYNGEIMGILPANQADLERIGMMMAGVHRAEPEVV
ncbi:MAG: ABC transporter ATP-binding protein [Anaerolineae bacterium]|nr:ABC transporter ATP-binding protein [Anaerolineae bacterium]MDW8069032.1 ABC transporter ATP-binding protein [Anaerolineae bacterium]